MIRSALDALLTVALATPTLAQTPMPDTLSFTVTGAYQFTEAFTVHADDPLVHADAGRIAGAWRFEFDDGTSGSCHVNGATANRITPSGAALFGTMKLDMFEVTGDATRADALYLAYESTSFYVDGPTVDIVVEGQFVGGAGRYAGATGSVRVRSVNGHIGEGNGTLILGAAPEVESVRTMSVDDAEAAVAAYFEATQSGDASVWAARFAEGAVVEDPVGQPVLRTREAIQAQGEAFMEAFKEVGLYPDFVQVSGNRASAKWTGRGTTTDGRRVEFGGVNVWTFAPDGRVATLVGYWDPSEMREIESPPQP